MWGRRESSAYPDAGEEANENYSLDESIGHVKLLASIDPYNHPRAIHNVQTPTAKYIDTTELDLTSIQTWPSSAARLNELGVTWAEACMTRGKRPLVVNFDEARPPEDRRSVWVVYMARGLWEPIVYSPDNFAVHEPLWRELAAARRFIESLPFAKMFPANWLLSESRGFCLAKPGKAYGVYLPAGGSVALEAPEGAYRMAWYDPREGRFLAEQSVSGPRLELTAPDDQDWAVRVLAVNPRPTAPSAASARVHSLQGAAVDLTLALWDTDAPEIYDVEIVSPPSHGTLAGSGPHLWTIRRPPEHGRLDGADNDVLYTPEPGFIGTDKFSWAVSDGLSRSRNATVTISVR